jgi:hypothetical protein
MFESGIGCSQADRIAGVFERSRIFEVDLGEVVESLIPREFLIGFVVFARDVSHQILKTSQFTELLNLQHDHSPSD